MNDRIVLTGMRFEGHHGVSEEERAFPQMIEVDLEVEADLARAGRTDDVADTIDYGSLVALVRGIVERGSYRLLEAIAAAISDRVLESTTASAVTVRVRKLAVPLEADLDHAAVHLRRERHVTGPGVSRA